MLGWWGEVRWGEVRWGEVRWGEVRWGEVRRGEVRLGYLLLGYFTRVDPSFYPEIFRRARVVVDFQRRKLSRQTQVGQGDDDCQNWKHFFHQNRLGISCCFFWGRRGRKTFFRRRRQCGNNKLVCLYISSFPLILITSGWKTTNLTSVFTLRTSLYRCLMVLCWWRYRSIQMDVCRC